MSDTANDVNSRVEDLLGRLPDDHEAQDMETTELVDVIEHADELTDRIDDSVDVETESVSEHLVEFYAFDLTGESAEGPVINQIAANRGLQQEEVLGGPASDEAVNLDTIDSDGEFVTVEAEVRELWDPRSDAIDQVGLLHDDTGIIKFVAFDGGGIPVLTEGVSYRFSPVITDEYEGNYSVKMNNATEEVEALPDTEFEPPEQGSDDAEITGPVVDVQSGSGLIKRCPKDDCSRTVSGSSDECKEHGSVNGEYDLRIKAVVDTGADTQRIVLDRELTTELTGVDLEQAKQILQDTLEPQAVTEEMEAEILLNYYDFTGAELDEYFIVNEFQRQTEPVAEIDELVMRAGSLSLDNTEDDLTEVN